MAIPFPAPAEPILSIAWKRPNWIDMYKSCIEQKNRANLEHAINEQKS